MRLGLVALLGSLALASGAHGAVVQRSHPGLTILGARPGDLAGTSVAMADGKLLIGAPKANGSTGAVYLVAPGAPRKVRLGGPHTVTIKGTEAGSDFGWSVAATGDVNGDGVRDTIIGAPLSHGSAGSAYVIFGGGAGGFRIDGSSAGGKAGWQVGSAGDVNGDGRDDLFVTAPRQAAPGTLDDGLGYIYVVYGKPDPAPVDLANLGSGGFLIQPTEPGIAIAHAVAGGTDISGDHVPDLASSFFEEGDEDGGSVFTAFGPFDGSRRADDGPSSLPPVVGWRVNGGNGGSAIGSALAETPDMNGDGSGELVIGANGDGCGRSCRGESPTGNNRDFSGTIFVMFRQRAGALVNVRRPFAGFKVVGAQALAAAGSALASAGDLNGDGVPDIVIGAPGSELLDPGHHRPTGEVYVVYGRRGYTTVDLRRLGARGFSLQGSSLGRVGSVVAAGRFGGGRFLVAGAPKQDHRRGAVYLSPAMGVAISSGMTSGRVRVRCLLRSRCKGTLAIRRGQSVVERAPLSISPHRTIRIPVIARGHLSVSATVRAPGGRGSSTATARVTAK